MRIKDTTSHMHRTLSWPCLSAYLFLALTIVIGLYVGVNWQFQSAIHGALKQQLSQPLETRVATWLFALAFLGIFASTTILHHVFASISLKRLETSMRRDSSQDITEQSLSPLPDSLLAILGVAHGAPAEENRQSGLRQEDHQQPPEDTQALGTVTDQSCDSSDNFASASQELHTPMSKIIGMTRKLLETSLDDDQQQYMIRLREETSLLTRMLDELLGFSELETQHFQK